MVVVGFSSVCTESSRSMFFVSFVGVSRGGEREEHV